jgi:hypothetical protein
MTKGKLYNMKKILLIATFLSVTFYSCKKPELDDNSVIVLQNTVQSKGGNGNGGGGTTAGILQNFGPFVVRLKSGDPTQLLVSFTAPAPAGGYNLTFTSTNAAMQVPATYNAPEGSYVVYVPVTTTVISGNAVSVTLTVRLGTESKSAIIKLYPLSFTFTAPSLQSPGNNANFSNPKLVTFKWADNNNAFYHYLQVSNNPTFTNPLWHEISVENPIYATSYFGNNVRYYWRVCYVDASGNLGPWSAVRTFFYRG